MHKNSLRNIFSGKHFIFKVFSFEGFNFKILHLPSSLNVAHFIGNILLIHLPDVLIPVVATGHSSTPYMVFMRILSTVIHVMCWYDENPFDPNSKTHKSLLTVRRNCHMAVSRMMNNKYPRKNRLWLSQFDMAMTQWSLIGIVGIRPKQCGFHSTTKYEFEEYIYFWKVIGYCVGIEDRFNVCLDKYDESVEYLNICFQRCYKVHLDRQCQVVKLGMNLTEGVFLGKFSKFAIKLKIQFFFLI